MTIYGLKLNSQVKNNGIAGGCHEQSSAVHQVRVTEPSQDLVLLLCGVPRLPFAMDEFDSHFSASQNLLTLANDTKASPAQIFKLDELSLKVSLPRSSIVY